MNYILQLKSMVRNVTRHRNHTVLFDTLFFYKDIFYEDNEVEICQILRIF